MTRDEILKLIDRYSVYLPCKVKELADILSTRYEFTLGTFEAREIEFALRKHNPVIIDSRIIIGFDNRSSQFIDHENKPFAIQRTIPAIIVTASKTASIAPDPEPVAVEDGEAFAIVGKCEWSESDMEQFNRHIAPLKIGASFLPAHSAIFNFLADVDNGQQSGLSGAFIFVKRGETAFNDILTEIGRLFYRTRLTLKERDFFESSPLSPSAITEKEIDTNSAEDFFCTIYRWYMKSIFLHKSFLNILEHSEPMGCNFLKGVIARIAGEKTVADTFELAEPEIDAYINPRYDAATKRYIRKQGALDRIKNVELPGNVLRDVAMVDDGTTFVYLNKAKNPVPVIGRRIDFSRITKPGESWSALEKSRSLTHGKPVVFVDMDGCVADFEGAYKAQFKRDCRKDDLFTVRQFVQTNPRFFRKLPVIESGRELVEELQKDYTVVFLTSPMDGMEYCKSDKVAWAADEFPMVKTILFSSHKEEYAGSDRAILIDDTDYNLKPFEANGGTAININLGNKKILERVRDAFAQKEEVKAVEAQLKNMDVNLFPTDEQKETGQYKKGDLVFKGMKIKIENPKGSIRFGFDERGMKWVQKMKNHYGYIQNAPDGCDGDKIDCFIGDKFNGNRVFVVNQQNPSSGLFDEHKIMLCFDNMEDAKAAYMANYSKDWKGFMSIIPTNTKKLREWLDSGNKTEPFGTLHYRDITGSLFE